MKTDRFALLLIAALLVALTACGGGSDAGSAGSARQKTTASASEGNSASQGTGDSSGQAETLAFVAPSGASVSIDENMKDVLEDLGPAQSCFEAPSCAFEGLDKTYTYSGFVITTRPDGDEDFVSSIRLTDDSVTTPEGVYVGSSEEDVVAAYGEGTKDEAELRYTRDGTVLSFILEEGAVVSIEYLAE